MRMLLVSLRSALYDAVSKSGPESHVGVAFSGGVDSALLARICQDLGKKVTSITVGFRDSHDVGFSKAIASKMGMEHKVLEIAESDLRDSLESVQQIARCENTSHIENCLAYFYVAKVAASAGLEVVLSANGCDELFCGYNGYRMVYAAGEAALMKFMDEKIANEFELVEEISAVASHFGITVRQPFLSREFIEFAKSIPLHEKITGPDDIVRKHILRAAALQIGVPEESAMKPKKALQYGSSIHKHFKKASA